MSSAETTGNVAKKKQRSNVDSKLPALETSVPSLGRPVVPLQPWGRQRPWAPESPQPFVSTLYLIWGLEQLEEGQLSPWISGIDSRMPWVTYSLRGWGWGDYMKFSRPEIFLNLQVCFLWSSAIWRSPVTSGSGQRSPFQV